jgi:hypothetical protein
MNVEYHSTTVREVNISTSTQFRECKLFSGVAVGANYRKGVSSNIVPSEEQSDTKKPSDPPHLQVQLKSR